MLQGRETRSVCERDEPAAKKGEGDALDLVLGEGDGAREAPEVVAL